MGKDNLTRLVVKNATLKSQFGLDLRRVKSTFENATVIEDAAFIKTTLNTEVHLGIEQSLATVTFDTPEWDATSGVNYFVDIADTGGDLIDVTGTATLGGVLNVSDAGATLAEGSQFTIVSSPSVGGAFDLKNSSLPVLPSGLMWIGLYGEYDPDSPGEEAVLRVSGVGISGDPTVDEGTLYTLDFVADPSITVDNWRVDWGDGSEPEDWDGSLTQAFHTYADGPKHFTITATAIINGVEHPAGMLPVFIQNVAPLVDSLDLDSYEINENGSVTLSGAFTDPGFTFLPTDPDTGLPLVEYETFETFGVVIDWGDDSDDTEIDLNNEERTFEATHQYLDDNPTGTPSDSYEINVTITDDDGGVGTGSTFLTVDNVDPVVTLNLDATTVDENGTVTATGSVTDVGTLDTISSLDIDWGDGTVEAVTLQADGTYSINHTYVDDDPSGTPSDDYSVTITATDDDTGQGYANATVTVLNVNPVIVLDPVADVDEGGDATLTGTITDIGLADTHEVYIDWGDGWSEYVTVVNGAFSATHTYEDDDPSGTASDVYTITATVEDDDTGSDTQTATLTVHNLPPTVVIDPLSDTNEGDTFYVSGMVTDSGISDTYTVTIDWGDGQSEDFFVDSSGFFDAYHTYEDDDPTGTASDVYTITVTAEDDDTGTGSATAQFTVNNVDPTVDSVLISGTPAFPGDPITVESDFSDPADSFDSYTYVVDWGDDTSTGPQIIGYGSLISEDHAYATAGDYTITVTVTDDDGGSGNWAELISIGAVDPSISGFPEVNEGEDYSLDLSDATNNGADSWEIDWDDGSPVETVLGSPAGVLATHTYLDDDPTATSSDDYTITATAYYNGVAYAADPYVVTVDNVAPTLYYTDDYTEVTDGIELTVDGDFTDVDADSHTLTIDWGDGTSDTLSFGPGADRTFSLTHDYIEPGADPDWKIDYSYTITVEDDDLGMNSGSGSGSVSGSGDPITAATPAPESSQVEGLKVSELVPVFQEAVARWDALFDLPAVERALCHRTLRLRS